MKRSRSEGVYLFLTLLVIITSATIYFLYGDHKVASSTTNHQVTNTSIVSKATVALEALEKNPQEDDIASVQKLVDQITNSLSKKKLQTRLNAVSTELTHQTEAETAVTEAETLQTQTSIDEAQTAIDTVSNISKKSELQSRLDTISDAINSQVSLDTTTSYYTPSQYDYDGNNTLN